MNHVFNIYQTPLPPIILKIFKKNNLTVTESTDLELVLFITILLLNRLKQSTTLSGKTKTTDNFYHLTSICLGICDL